MDELKLKSISLSKTKISEAEVEGRKERRVTFVASSNQEDRDYEVIDIGSFRLPKKGGGSIVVSSLPLEGSEEVDVPLLTDHNLWNVDKTIGSVRRAFYQDEKLIFEAGISSRSYAQDMLTLLEEGHLDNAFSIQFGDYMVKEMGDKIVISDGEILEVSLVTRGSNKEAQLLEVKSAKGKEMDPEKDTQETTDTAVDQNVDQGAEDTQTNNEATDQTTENGAQDAPKQTEDTNESKGTQMNQKEIAAKQVQAPSQVSTATKSAPADYLKSKQADHDFARTIVECYGQSTPMIMKAWKDKIRAKGITGDAILPSSIEQIFFKAWEDHYEALGTFRRTTKLSGSVYAFNTTDRALGHKKGDKKAEQSISDVRRDYKAKIMYKKLAIDLQDLIDDETGELLRMRVEELSDRIGDELVRAIVFGDGRTAPAEGQPDYRIFDGTRGPWSMVSDINASATAGSFSAAVATKIANVDSDTTYQKIIKTRGAIRGGIGRKIIFVPEGTITDLQLMTKDNGEPLFAPGTDFQNLFGVYIFESPYMAGSGFDVLGYRENSYLLAMGDMMVRTMFDLDYNTDVMLQERAVAGTAFGHKVLAGYASKA